MHTRHFDTLQLSLVNKHTLLITLNRPAVRNALDTKMTSELLEIWQTLYIHPAQYKAVILTGNGDKAFCAGADLKERHGITTKLWLEQHAVLEQMMLAMHNCPIPVIAAVNGTAFGGGLELVLNCDFAYACPDATFAFPEARLGFIPGAMGTQWLPRALGLARARELCMTASVFTAQQGLAWGLLNRLVPLQSLLDETLKCAADIEGLSALAVRQVKQALNATAGNDLLSGYKQELALYRHCIENEDRIEGIEAFNEKRPAVFK